jgi:hypothetical protein
LRTGRDDPDPEIWCRCDGGPHGFLSIAAHAHADALSIEVRVGGVDVLADPGTYCYHGEPAWRDYFRSTLAHNTIEVAGADQSTTGGPFLWVRHATGTTLATETADTTRFATWTSRHDGYAELDRPAVHRRTVVLDRADRRLRVVDVIDGAPHNIRLAYHFGPDVLVELDDTRAQLTWPGGAGTALLPEGLSWSAHRGETEPLVGWYSPRFGHKVPTTALIGRGQVEPGAPLVSMFGFPCQAAETRISDAARRSI